jgi:hypothetical protein
VKRLLIGTFVIVLAVGLGGCKSVSEKIGEEIVGGVIGGDVDVSEDEVTIQTDEGDVTIAGGEGALTEGFPKDCPIYKDSTVESSSRFESGEQVQYYATLQAPDSVGDVHAWYKGEFESEGWSIENDFKMSADDGETAMLYAKKGDLEASATMSQRDGGTEIVLVVLEAK